LFALSLAAVTPTLLAQLLTTYNDVFVAAFFASALAFAVIAGRDPIWINLLALALSCGALLAAKLSAPLLIVAGASGVLRSTGDTAIRSWKACEVDRIRSSRRLGARGGHWYLRNFLSYGNPFYPFRIHFAGLSLPAKYLPANWSTDLLNPELSGLPLLKRLWKLWLEQKSHYGYWFYNYDSAYAGFGPIWFVLGIPSVVCALILSLKKRRWCVFSVLFLTVAAYLTFGGNISVRYTLFVLPAMVLAVAVMIDQLQFARWGDRKKMQSSVACWTLLAVRSLGAILALFTLGLLAFAVKNPAIARKQILTSTVAKVEVDAPVVGVFAAVRPISCCRSPTR
jgi:hypothetical protein